MAKSKTPSFILTLKLNTGSSDEAVLSERFYYAFLMKNRLIRHARRALSSMRQDKDYRLLMNEYASLKGKKDSISKQRRSDIGKALSIIRTQYGLSEYQFHRWIAVQQHRYQRHIDSLTAQKIATSVWSSVEAVLYRKGKSIHFQKIDNLYSLEGKNNVSGIRFKNGRLFWNGLIIQPYICKDDIYAVEALKHRVKYCRIKRMAMRTTYHYYLDLVLEGIPPKKHTFINGRVGIDPGLSSEAVFSEQGCILTELAGAKNISKECARLQRKLDRSRRANNPDHFNPDGTVKKICKPWVESNTYKRDSMRLKTLRRKNAAAIKQAETILANEILCTHGTDIITEKMDYRALQLKAKEDKISPKTGKHQSRKRFGRNIAKHAPSRFLSILERKLSYINKTVNYVDTWKFKASQYDHVVGDYNRVPLSCRSKMVGPDRVQRDLYSAFLLWCANDPETVDRNLCNGYFPLFLSFQGACIDRLLSSDQTVLSSFGLKDFAT